MTKHHLIREILNKAKHGDGCGDCPRKNGHFASCCEKHFSVNANRVEAVLIFQEPPISPEDELICPYHHHDQSAINIRYFLEHYNIDPKKIYLTNAILHGTSEKIKATQKVIKACAEILRRQVDCLRPRVIVAFGDIAARALEQSFDIEKLAYLPEICKVRHDDKTLKVCKTYHLSGLNFNANKLGRDIENHWNKLSKILPRKGI